MADASTADGPPPGSRLTRRMHLLLDLRQLYRAKDLVVALMERELRVRYKQAYLGVAWAVFTPAILMIVFTLLLSHHVLNVTTGGKPAVLFSYIALVPWTVFANAMGQGSQSLLSNIYLVNKIYCPREVFPLSSVIVAVVDGSVSSLLLLILFPATGTHPASTSYWVPLLFLIEIVFTTGITLILAIVVVYMRDLRQVIPVIVQFGLFATPIAYQMDKVSHHLQPIYSVLNPLAPLIDGCRRAALFGETPQWNLVGFATISAVVFLAAGYILFRRFEGRIADVA